MGKVKHSHQEELKKLEHELARHEEGKGADAAALVTEWPEFRELDLVRVHKLMRIPLILDGRNLYDPAVARTAGFTYCSVGRP